METVEEMRKVVVEIMEEIDMMWIIELMGKMVVGIMGGME